MSYRFEKNPNGDPEIIIDGWEKGIADSPYEGIANIRNLNIKYYPKVAYANYKRLPATLSWGTFTFTGTLSTGATSATLTSAWPYVTGSYNITFSNADVRLATFTNSSTTVGWAGAGGLSSNATATITVANGVIAKPTFECTGNTGIKYIMDDLGQVWKQDSLNGSSFTIIHGSPTTGASGQGIAFWKMYLIVFRTNFIDFCGDGTGDGGVTSSNWNTGSTTWWPLGNITTMTLTSTIAAGDTSATISTYTDTNGNAHSGSWLGATGIYQLTMSSGQKIAVTLTYNSPTISFAHACVGSSTTSVTIQLVIGTSIMTWVSRNDGNLYFCNGAGVGSMSIPSAVTDAGGVFAPANVATFNVSYAALKLPINETAIWLDELQTNLIVAGNRTLYPWGRITTTVDGTPIPIPEQISKFINILNNLYIFAGFKGNIYLSNGYSAYPFKKIPDYIANTLGISEIDPQWQWGGIMSHRLRLFFQAIGLNAAGTNIVSGIFSVGLVSGNGVTLETPGSLVLENQNSYGLNASTTTPGGVLIDNSTTGLAYDNYYSAWRSGVGDVGGIDYNNTTLNSNNEMVIETDLIPVGTFIQPRTFSSAEFKMDQPMKSGDSITLYARASLSEAYVQLGTTSTQLLSDLYTPLNFQKSQWLQFMITMSCNSTATSSSFNRLREMRIR